ncbi:MAG: hypothetical protein R8M38_04390 [Mariprofundaceae bacterium]
MLGIGSSSLDLSAHTSPYTDPSVVHLYMAAGTLYGGGFSNSPAYTNLAGWVLNDYLMIAVDLDNRRLYFGKNGVWGTGTYNANPSAGTGGIPLPDGTGSGFEFAVCSSHANSENYVYTRSSTPANYPIPTNYKLGLPIT